MIDPKADKEQEELWAREREEDMKIMEEMMLAILEETREEREADERLAASIEAVNERSARAYREHHGLPLYGVKKKSD